MINNDTDDEIEMDDSSFDEFEENKERTLGTILDDNPMLKIGLIVGAIIIVFGAIIIFGGRSAPIEQSVVAGGSDISAPPGTETASPDYIDAIQEVNERNVEIAQQTGGSALPTPIEPPVGILTVPEQEVPEEDPLERWRRLQKERLQNELQETQTIDPTPAIPDTGRGDRIGALAELFSQQMQGILDSQRNDLTHLPITSEAVFAESREASLAAGGGSGTAGGAGEDIADIAEQETLVAAGQIAYAQLLIEANTDAPGPVLAQIVSGPLNGSRILGTFETQRSVLTLTFNTVVIDGVSTGVDAIALDPNTSLPGLATEVDRRYLSRVLLPAAGAFIEGAADAIAESGRTTITIDGDTVSEETADADDEQEIASGIAEAGAEIREIVDEEADAIEPLIRIAAGTPMGILFLEPVEKDLGDSP